MFSNVRCACMYCMTMARREAVLVGWVQTIEGLQVDHFWVLNPPRTGALRLRLGWVVMVYEKATTLVLGLVSVQFFQSI